MKFMKYNFGIITNFCPYNSDINSVQQMNYAILINFDNKCETVIYYLSIYL